MNPRRNLTLYYLSVFITNAGNSCSFLALGKFSLDAFGLASAYGTILLLEQVKAVSLSLLGGRLADRFGSKTMAVFCDFALFVTGTLFGVLALFGYEKFAIVGAALTINLAKPFYSPALFAFLKDIVPDEKLKEVNSGAAAAQQLGWIAGLLAAAIGILGFSAGWMILFDSITYLLSGFTLLLCVKIVHSPSLTLVKDASKERISRLNELRLMLRSDAFVWMLAIGVQINLIVAYNVGLFKLVASNFPGKPSFLSFMEFAFAAAVALSALRKGRGLSKKTVGLCFIAQGLALVLLPHSSSIVATLFLSAAFSFSGSLIFPVAFDSLYRSVEKSNLGRVGGVKGLIQAAVAVPMLVSVNGLLDGVGLSSAYLLLAMVSIAMGFGLHSRFFKASESRTKSSIPSSYSDENEGRLVEA